MNIAPVARLVATPNELVIILIFLEEISNLMHCQIR